MNRDIKLIIVGGLIILALCTATVVFFWHKNQIECRVKVDLILSEMTQAPLAVKQDAEGLKHFILNQRNAKNNECAILRESKRTIRILAGGEGGI